MSDWKPELEAIVGARHGGRVTELLDQLKDLDRRYPNVAEIAYQLAWTCDTLGQEQEALPWYEKAVALGLPPNELAGALLGLGSTLRVLGQADRAIAVLRSAQTQFPENREFDAFLALALHAAGGHAEAIALLIAALCDATEDPGVTAYQRALRYHARKLA